MLKPLDSHKSVTVSTVMTHDRPDILRTLKNFTFDKKDRLNYNYERINWFDYEAISLYRRDRKIVGFSTISHRPEYYEPDECRILNRYYEFPTMRRTSKVVGGDHVCLMVKQQIKFAKKLGYKKVFMSRTRSPKYMFAFARMLTEKIKHNWIIEKKKVPVCDPSIDSCWQWKAWTTI